ncbi:hypothetical protein KY345_01860 [Candidatus Woesearchaeota archaeon]|nr:hypothetical protein [Candidatus Woesearchaeota archaeon]
MKDEIFKFGLKNEFRPKISWYNIKTTIGRRISISIFNLLLAAVALIIIGMIITKCPSCQECPILNESECPECEECICEEPEPQKELRVVSTYVCRDGTIAGDPKDCDIKEELMQKYVCDDGTVVDNAEDCIEELVLDTEYQKQENDLLLAINNIEYEMKGDDWGTITSVDYAVKNFVDDPILPHIQIRVFDVNDSLTSTAETRETIKVQKTLEKDEFVQDTEDVYVSFKGTNITVKFVLVNGLEEIQQSKVVLEVPLYDQ